LEDFAYKEDVPEQSKSLEGGVSQLSKSECKSEVRFSFDALQCIIEQIKV
jgi:hypothetical protein